LAPNERLRVFSGGKKNSSSGGMTDEKKKEAEGNGLGLRVTSYDEGRLAHDQKTRQKSQVLMPGEKASRGECY